MTDTVIVICNADVVNELTSELSKVPEATIERSDIRHLDGQIAADWVLLIGGMAKGLPALIDALTRFLTRNNLESITVGDVEMKNPRPEDVPVLLQAARTSRQ